MNERLESVRIDRVVVHGAGAASLDPTSVRSAVASEVSRAVADAGGARLEALVGEAVAAGVRSAGGRQGGGDGR